MGEVRQVILALILTALLVGVSLANVHFGNQERQAVGQGGAHTIQNAATNSMATR